MTTILDSFNLEPYIYTKKVRVMDGVIPHSHPLLTIHTDDDTIDKLLSTFIHEQLHWYILSKWDESEKAIERIKDKYPSVPYRFPAGSGSLSGTYNHLLINFLEYDILIKLLGKERARSQIEYLKGHHYKWIYRTVENDFDTLKSIIEPFDLIIN